MSTQNNNRTGSSVSKETACNEGDLGSVSGLGRSPEKIWQSTSSILAWEIPWTEEPRGLHSPWGHKESDTTWQ